MMDNGSFRLMDHPILGPLDDADHIEIVVDGRPLAARAGETLAASLLAHGIRRFRSMPETGTARGYFCGVGRCTDCTVTVDGVLNVLACTTIVQDGMDVRSQQGLGEWMSPA